MRKSEGFGIAGHRNTYKTGVRCGNWVEDKIGMDMVRTGHRNPSHFVSEAQANFIAPTKMDDKAVRMCPPTTYTDAAGGLPAHLLFAHGMEPHNPRAGEDTRLMSMSQALFGESKVSSKDVLADHQSDKTLEALKKRSSERSKAAAKTAARDRSMGTQMVTEASTTMRRGAPAPAAERHDRSAHFTKEFRTGIPGLRR